MRVGQTIERADFTQPQIESAKAGGEISAFERARRQVVDTYTIDDVEPYVASDRDDGIRVEETPEGYRVHVTIADVAAHVSLDDPLADAAYNRAFTVYRPNFIDHMFPTELMNKMSLEDDKERLGMQVSIDLDKNFHPVHTEFARVITKAHAQSYGMAMRKMADGDPQFSLMAKIAMGVRENYLGDANDLALDEMEGRPIAEMSKGRIHLDHMRTAPDYPATDFMRASRLVEVYMLLANNQVAQTFADSKMPFLFRNFLNTRKFEDGKPDRAFYDLSWKKHEALEDLGLKGPYCHFTSPIRRGPDFYCGHMAHYAIDVVDKTAALLPHSATEAAKLKHILWDHLPNLLHVIQAGTETDLYAELQAICKKAGIQGIEESQREALWKAFITLTPPLNGRNMEKKLNTINALNDTEAKALDWLVDDEMSERGDMLDLQEQLEEFELRTYQAWQECDATQFTSKLRDAAWCGYMSDTLYEACKERLEGTLNNSSKKVDPHFLQNAAILIFESPYYLDERWLGLKRAVCETIKNHPESPQCVNGILDIAQSRDLLRSKSTGAATTLETFSLPADGPDADAENSLEFSLVTFASPKYGEISAPFYSIGNSQRASESHAKYAFLEHMAFGQLSPATHAYLPNPAYAELENTNDKQSLVKQMLEDATKDGDAPHLSVETRPISGGRYACTATVEGGFFSEPIVINANDSNEKDAENRALRRLMRHRNFSLAVAQPLPRSFYFAQHPNQFVKEFAEGLGMEVVFNDFTAGKDPRYGPYTCEIQLLKDGEVVASERSETLRSNKAHARRDASQALIESQGWNIENPISVVNGKSMILSWPAVHEAERAENSALAK